MTKHVAIYDQTHDPYDQTCGFTTKLMLVCDQTSCGLRPNIHERFHYIMLALRPNLVTLTTKHMARTTKLMDFTTKLMEFMTKLGDPYDQTSCTLEPKPESTEV